MERYHELASKWLNGSITESEKAEFTEWYNSKSDESLSVPEFFASKESEIKDRIMGAIRQKIAAEKAPRAIIISGRRMIAAAAVFIIMLSGGLFYYFAHSPTQNALPAPVALEDVKPGKFRATLVLSDGRKIELSPEKNGIVAGNDVKYMDGTSIAGEHGNDLNQKSKKILFQTVSTPKGGQYQITLPDGSMVWLNSASSLRYPSEFSGSERAVELLSGEAYFDIRKQSSGIKKIPFVVKTGGQEVKVLGTQFNINAYNDEIDQQIATTLVEGSVRVSNPLLGNVLLSPGNQAIQGVKAITVKKVETEVFTSWKDGYFYFNNADLRTVLLQFSRWYDIKVSYEITDNEDSFVGKIPRNVNLSTALNVLKSAGVKFEIKEGNHLIVKPK